TRTMAKLHPKRGNGFKDLTGQQFGDLTVIEYAGSIKGLAFWKCQCKCGGEKVTRGISLRKGDTTSCGCAFIRTITKHGATVGSKTSEYTVWSGMKHRCLNPDAKFFSHYGGRGITVCERWMKFENFLEAMGPRPKGFTLERIDNSKGYSKENCVWASRKQQSNNNRRNRVIEVDGVSKTATQWAEQRGIRPGTILNRLFKGWSPVEAVSTPLRR